MNERTSPAYRREEGHDSGSAIGLVIQTLFGQSKFARGYRSTRFSIGIDVDGDNDDNDDDDDDNDNENDATTMMMTTKTKTTTTGTAMTYSRCTRY